VSTAAASDLLDSPTEHPVRATAPTIDLVRSGAVLALAGGLIWWLIPRVTATPWPDIATLLGSLTTWRIAGLALLWATGLVLHSYVLTGSLPGLSHRRALTLNLTGSAVSNLLPAGGAAGVATNLMMMRRWSIPAVRFTAFTLVSNAWDVAAKLALPAVAVAAVLLGHQVLPPLLVTGAVVAAVGLILASAALLALRRLRFRDSADPDDPASSAGAEAEGRRENPFRRLLRHGVEATRDALPMALQTAGANWPRLSAGMTAYLAAQAALMWACLAALGTPAAVTTVLAAFAVERLTTLVPITPAGTGLAEAGAVTVLVAMGYAPAPAAAGVLLYRLFTVVLEIPVGALWLAGWSHAGALRP